MSLLKNLTINIYSQQLSINLKQISEKKSLIWRLSLSAFHFISLLVCSDISWKSYMRNICVQTETLFYLWRIFGSPCANTDTVPNTCYSISNISIYKCVIKALLRITLSKDKVRINLNTTGSKISPRNLLEFNTFWLVKIKLIPIWQTQRIDPKSPQDPLFTVKHDITSFLHENDSK